MEDAEKIIALESISGVRYEEVKPSSESKEQDQTKAASEEEAAEPSLSSFEDALESAPLESAPALRSFEDALKHVRWQSAQRTLDKKEENEEEEELSLEEGSSSPLKKLLGRSKRTALDKAGERIQELRCKVTNEAAMHQALVEDQLAKAAQAELDAQAPVVPIQKGELPLRHGEERTAAFADIREATVKICTSLPDISNLCCDVEEAAIMVLVEDVEDLLKAEEIHAERHLPHKVNELMLPSP